MTVQAFNVGDELGQLIAQGRISQQALTAITGIAPESLATYLNTGPGLSTAATGLSQDEIARASALTVQLTEGAAIDDDERLHAIVETLAAQFDLSHENIALLTRTRLEDLQAFLSDPTAAPAEFKFKLAVRAYYLFHAVLNAAPDPSRP
jgi:hypothetical protein